MGSLTQWSHETVLPAEVASPAKAREFVCTHLLEHQLPSLIDDVLLVASELATNATVHARTWFTVALAGVDGTVVLAVQDESAVLPARFQGEVLDAGGRGLAIVQAISLDWGARLEPNGGKSVWASFDVHGPGRMSTPGAGTDPC